MKNLLYKEFLLFFHPAFFLCLLFGALLLIPSWPYFIAFGYLLFMVFSNAFFIGRTNRDVLFTASLPVRKKDLVRARVYAVALFELLQVITAIPFAVINNAFYTEGNMAGMNTNFAFFGFVLVIYGLFNLVFLPGFYKTAYKIGVPMILGIIVDSVFALAVTAAVLGVPALNAALNGLGAANLPGQLPVLFAGIALFVLLTLVAYRVSAKRFETVDL
jgi:hypothetical protein